MADAGGSDHLRDGTHEKLKVDAVVGVEILEGDDSRRLQVDGVEQRGRALVRVGGDVITVRGPG